MRRSIPPSVAAALHKRNEQGALRSVAPFGCGVDLCSNDYLGIARKLTQSDLNLAQPYACLGATGSRLISGTTPEHQQLEEQLAVFHQSQAALLFGSGYEANLGLLGSLGGRNDTIIYDQYSHASMRDGIRLSSARSYSFTHNDLDDLRKKIAQARGDVFVAVESIYSMDGDLAPLRELTQICEEKGAYLIVDEAHSTGVYGERGEGLVQAEGLADKVFARVHTFGKALGYRGAVVVGDVALRDYLVNFARSFIYATAPDQISIRLIRRAYEFVEKATIERDNLSSLVCKFRSLADSMERLKILPSRSHIQGVIIPTNAGALAAQQRLEESGIFAKAIRAPTVAAGTERIRVSLHSFNTHDDLERAFKILSSVEI